MSAARPTPPAPALALSPSRRGYRGLVVALAAFLLAITLLRQPFRGYLAEVRITGHAGEEVDLASARAWLAAAADGMSVQLVRSPLYPGDCELQVQRLARRLPDANTELNNLARRFLENYLPQQLADYRQARLSRLQSELAAARDAEDTQRIRVEELRSKQLARVAERRSGESAAEEDSLPTARTFGVAASSGPSSELRKRLALLRAELARLLSTCTEEHPQVITIRSQISRLEAELAAPAGELRLDPAASARPLPAEMRLVSTASLVPVGPTTDLAAELETATAELAAASRNRQWAERQLQTAIDRAAAREALPTWSATPARVVARVGGTPTIFTLLVAGLMSAVAGGAMFRLATRVFARPLIDSAEQLATLLPVPLVGQTPAGRCSLNQRLVRIGPAMVRGGTRAAELLIIIFAGVCLVSVLADQTLAAQFVADPFGALSEVVGRIGGG
ncbi:MAG: hypothetical protein SFU86_06065 [Pirellulaceae bacterium]|nr:hypothetical protein [Pirellulaceae bacterium]